MMLLEVAEISQSILPVSGMSCDCLVFCSGRIAVDVAFLRNDEPLVEKRRIADQ